MKVIKPVTFDEATMLLSSNAIEAYAVWDVATTYAKDAIVDYGTDLWISLQNSNTGNVPSDAGSLFWALVGPDNKHAMFDGQVSTVTTSSSPLEVVCKPGIVNSLALVGLVGSSVTVELQDAGVGPVLYSRELNLDGTIIGDWYMYFFEPFVQLGEVVLTDIPPYANGHITVTLTSGGSVAIGELIFGTAYDLGEADMEQGATISIIDYSRKDTNKDTGVTTFVRRAFSKRMSGRFLLSNNQINEVQRILADIRAVPSVFIGSEAADYSSLIVYGFYRDFSIDIAYPTKSYCRLEVEGLI